MSSSSEVEGNHCYETHPLDCEWICGYPKSAPQDPLPPRRRFVLQQPSSSSRDNAKGTPVGVVGSSSSVLLSFAKTGDLTKEKMASACCLDRMGKGVMHKIVAFAGVEDASLLLMTNKAMASTTDRWGSYILPELLTGRRRLSKFAKWWTKGRLGASHVHYSFDSAEGERVLLPWEFKRHVGDLVARFMALDPYFDRDQVLQHVFLPLMSIRDNSNRSRRRSSTVRARQGIKWARYHLWLPMLQWLQHYVHGSLSSSIAASASSSTSKTIGGHHQSWFPELREWAVWSNGHRPVCRQRTPPTSVDQMMVSMWIHLVNSRTILSSTCPALKHFTHMVDILVHSLDWRKSLSRFLDRTKDQLVRASLEEEPGVPALRGWEWSGHMMPVWRIIKLVLLRAAGTNYIDFNEMATFTSRFRPWLLFEYSDYHYITTAYHYIVTQHDDIWLYLFTTDERIASFNDPAVVKGFIEFKRCKDEVEKAASEAFRGLRQSQ